MGYGFGSVAGLWKQKINESVSEPSDPSNFRSEDPMSATIIELTPHLTRSQDRAVPNAEASALSELRRARIRIAQLEANLTQAMKDSLVHFNRARQAERRLVAMTNEHSAEETPPGKASL